MGVVGVVGQEKTEARSGEAVMEDKEGEFGGEGEKEEVWDKTEVDKEVEREEEEGWRGRRV